MPPYGVGSVGHRLHGDLQERKGRDLAPKGDRCPICSGGFVDEAWRSWDISALRQCAKGASGRCVLETNVAET